MLNCIWKEFDLLTHKQNNNSSNKSSIVKTVKKFINSHNNLNQNSWED